ncbi:hypothetical protein LA080_007936 [Diaporthe eres]|uniref:Uncharacterized protein n=1 Tax=Diaporthe vaccinii TaxID=105482 RepID=A0ABR4DRX4_9PEZI|nr:hypothetical protein LA080_007936 [Diaporthe eres]
MAASSSSESQVVALRRFAIVETESTQDNDTPGHTPCSVRISIHLFFDPSTNTASCRFQSNVALLVPTSRAPYNNTVLRSNTYLQAPPEHIKSLVYNRSPLPDRLAPKYQKLAGSEVICLRFVLSKPAQWIIPNMATLMPNAKEDANVLRVFQLIASRLEFTVYMSGRHLSEPQVSTICNAFSEPAGSNGRLTSSSPHVDISSWFHGYSPGGRVVDVEQVAQVVAAGSPTASPPSYDELAGSPQPPGLHVQRRSLRKRPKSQLSAGSSSGDEVATMAATRLQDLVLQAGLKEALLRRAIQEADDRLSSLADESTAQRDEVAEIVQDRLERLRAEVWDYIDERFDELFLDHVLKNEMEEYVDEAMSLAMDDLREKLSGPGVRLIIQE